LPHCASSVGFEMGTINKKKKNGKNSSCREPDGKGGSTSVKRGRRSQRGKVAGRGRGKGTTGGKKRGGKGCRS